MAGHPIDSFPGYRFFRRGNGTPWLAWRGTLGPVYKAEEIASGLLCALTVLPRALFPDSSAADHAWHEIERLRGLRHPNFVRPLALVHDPRGDSILVSEWVNGWPLEEWLRRRQSLNRSDLLAVLRQAATANEFAARHRFPGIELGTDQIYLQTAAPPSGEDPPPDGPLAGQAGLVVKFTALPIAPSVRPRADAGETTDPAADPGGRGLSAAGDSLLPLLYELLGRPARGLRGMPTRFSPFSGLNEAANALLRAEADEPRHGPGSSEAFFAALARALGVDPAAVPGAPPLPDESPADDAGPAPPPASRPVTLTPEARATGRGQVEFSEAVTRVWRHAASVAAEGGCRWIETAHFITALCQLDSLAQRRPHRPDVAREGAALAEVLGRFGLTVGGMRRAAQRLLDEHPPERVVGERARISRSLATKAAFARAVGDVDNAGLTPSVVNSLHLLAAILARAEPPFAGALCAGRVESGNLQRELLAAAGVV